MTVAEAPSKESELGSSLGSELCQRQLRKTNAATPDTTKHPSQKRLEIGKVSMAPPEARNRKTLARMRLTSSHYSSHSARRRCFLMLRTESANLPPLEQQQLHADFLANEQSYLRMRDSLLATHRG
jgi:hypothetical protein